MPEAHLPRPKLDEKIVRIILIGFMGAGKSTVGRLLAAHLGWAFYDSDALIEKEQQATVADIFSLRGEHTFRALEYASIASLVLHKRHAVISLGGGAVETVEVRVLLASTPDSRIIFLDAPLDLLVTRCLAQDGGNSRPILNDLPHLADRYRLRRSYYESAHHTVATQSLTPEEVAALIFNRLAAPHNGND